MESYHQFLPSETEIEIFIVPETTAIEEGEYNLTSWHTNTRIEFCEMVRESCSLSHTRVTFVEKASTYEIEDLDGTKRTQVAIKCPSLPEVWAYFGESPNEVITLHELHVAENYAYGHQVFVDDNCEIVKFVNALRFKGT